MSRLRGVLLGTAILAAAGAAPLAAQGDGAERLVGAMLGKTPLEDDLETLTDQIGGRATGSPANLRAVEWALGRFKDAGVDARKEPFQMPALWLERSAAATVKGEGASFSPRVVALPFSTATPKGGLTAPLVDAGTGRPEDFTALGARAIAAGAAGLVYMSSRPNDLLARHNASLGTRNDRPMMMMERDGAARAASGPADPPPWAQAGAHDPLRALERRGAESQRLVWVHAEPRRRARPSCDGLVVRHRDRPRHRLLHRRPR